MVNHFELWDKEGVVFRSSCLEVKSNINYWIRSNDGTKWLVYVRMVLLRSFQGKVSVLRLFWVCFGRESFWAGLMKSSGTSLAKDSFSAQGT